MFFKSDFESHWFYMQCNYSNTLNEANSKSMKSRYPKV